MNYKISSIRLPFFNLLLQQTFQVLSIGVLSKGIFDLTKPERFIVFFSVFYLLYNSLFYQKLHHIVCLVPRPKGIQAMLSFSCYSFESTQNTLFSPHHIPTFHCISIYISPSRQSVYPSPFHISKGPLSLVCNLP